MDDNVGNTQIRPALKSPRRHTAPPSPTTRQAQRRSTQRQGARPEYGAYASGHPRARNVRADQRAARRSDEPRTRNARRSSHAIPTQRKGIPVFVAVLLVFFAIVATAITSVLITRNLMLPQIKEAEQKAVTAQSQVTTLTQQLAKTAEAASSKTDDQDTEKKNTDDSSSSDDSSAKKDSETKETKEKETAESGVEDPWVKSGTFTSGDMVLDGEVKAFCDSVVNTSMTQEVAALEMYKGIAWSDYVERDSAQHPAGKDWRTKFARAYYENGCSGNCYEFASFLMYCLQYLGYDDAKAEGVEIEFQSGNWGDHGIVFVTNTDGSSCICDTARGTDGWMIPDTSYNLNILDFENA